MCVCGVCVCAYVNWLHVFHLLVLHAPFGILNSITDTNKRCPQDVEMEDETFLLETVHVTVVENKEFKAMCKTHFAMSEVQKGETDSDSSQDDLLLCTITAQVLSTSTGDLPRKQQEPPGL